MIIDAHTHFTTAPAQLQAYRGQQITNLAKPVKAKLQISDEEVARSMQGQLNRMKESGIDRLLFSPQAGAMGHHFGSPLVSRYWTEACNDLIARVAKLFPDKISPVCQLPQSPGVPRGVGRRTRPLCNGVGLRRLQRQSGRGRRARTVDTVDGQRVVVSALGKAGRARRAVHGARQRFAESGDASDQCVLYRAHNSAAVEILQSRVFKDFPKLKIIIPHGGGAIPYQWNRQRGMHVKEGSRTVRRSSAAGLLGHGDLRQGIDGAFDQARRRRPGAVRHRNVRRGQRHRSADRQKLRRPGADLQSIEGLSEQDRYNITEGNARRLYSRLFAEKK